MIEKRICLFYRTSSSSLIYGRFIGYCDLDCDRTTCDGEIVYCEKPDILKKYLINHKKEVWDGKKNMPPF